MATLPIGEAILKPAPDNTENKPAGWLQWTGIVLITTVDQQGLWPSEELLDAIRSHLQEDALEETSSMGVTGSDGAIEFHIETEGTAAFAAYSIVGLAIQAATKAGIDRVNMHTYGGELAPDTEVTAYDPASAGRHEARSLLMENVCYELNMVATGNIRTLQSVV